MPRYSSTWDINIVIQYIKEKMGNNLELSLKELTLKLAVLLALANATRASDLVALDVRFIQSTTAGLTFRIPKLTKTRRSGAPKSLPIARFEDLSLCPVHTVERYIDQTKDLRRPGNEGSNPLLISFRKPHNPVSTATVARWMKEVLSLAGINTETFSAHSTRAASVTAASERGVSIKQIMDAAGWSRLSTFETFYHKPPMTDFSEAVLSGKKGTFKCEYFEQYTVIYAALSRHGIGDFTRIFRSDVKSEFH